MEMLAAANIRPGPRFGLDRAGQVRSVGWLEVPLHCVYKRTESKFRCFEICSGKRRRFHNFQSTLVLVSIEPRILTEPWECIAVIVLLNCS